MGHQYFYDRDGKLTAIASFSDCYEYGGFRFEFHRYLGPSKIRKDGELAAKQGGKFYKAVEEWQKLPKKAREATRI